MSRYTEHRTTPSATSVRCQYPIRLPAQAAYRAADLLADDARFKIGIESETGRQVPLRVSASDSVLSVKQQVRLRTQVYLKVCEYSQSPKSMRS